MVGVRERPSKLALYPFHGTPPADSKLVFSTLAQVQAPTFFTDSSVVAFSDLVSLN